MRLLQPPIRLGWLKHLLFGQNDDLPALLRHDEYTDHSQLQNLLTYCLVNKGLAHLVVVQPDATSRD